MNKRKVALLRGAATVLLLAVHLLAAWVYSEASPSFPPTQGTPESAAGQAAQFSSLLPIWEDPGVFDTDPDQILPPGGSVTFTQPVVVAGDVEVLNETGGVVSLYD